MSRNPAARAVHAVVRAGHSVTRRPKAVRRVRIETPRTEMNATRVRTLNRMVDEQNARFGHGPTGPAEQELFVAFGRSHSAPVELLDDEIGTIRDRTVATTAVLDGAEQQLGEARTLTAALPDLTDDVGQVR